MADGEPVRVGADELIERFLAGHSERARKAYAADLADFASSRGRSPAEAVAELLAGPEPGRRLAREYAVQLRRRGRARATVQRRLSTLASLVRMAGSLGLVDWSLEVPSREHVADVDLAGRGSTKDLAYFLPRSPAEVDRLNVQHRVLREALGAHYVAPLRRPDRILDVGCGTGQWAYELCAEFPQALVVGLDLAPNDRPWPAGYRFVRANVLHGLPFADGGFDFVHQRALISGVPVQSWPSVCADLVRVTTPGGWVELVECPPWFESAGPETARLCGLLQQLLRARGLDADGTVFGGLDDHLRTAGLVDVGKRELDLPVGEWGGRIGSLMATDCCALFSRLAAAFEAMFGISGREWQGLVAEMQQEWEDHHATYRFAVATGRKPG